MNKKHGALALAGLLLLGGCKFSGVSSHSSSLNSYEEWLLSEEATDYDGNRKITEADYQIYLAYRAWLLSEEAYDYNGDAAVNYSDYQTYELYQKWVASTSAADMNGDGVIDFTDYEIAECALSFEGSYALEDFSYRGDFNILLSDSHLYLWELGTYLEGTKLNLTKTGEVSIASLPSKSAALGTDLDYAKQFLQNAHLAYLSATLYSFDSYFLYHGAKLNATLYLTLVKGGFTTTYQVRQDDNSGTVSVSFSRVKA